MNTHRQASLGQVCSSACLVFLRVQDAEGHEARQLLVQTSRGLGPIRVPSQAVSPSVIWGKVMQGEGKAQACACSPDSRRTTTNHWRASTRAFLTHVSGAESLWRLVLLLPLWTPPQVTQIGDAGVRI